MLYSDIANEILEDEELKKKYKLSEEPKLTDEDLIIKALKIIVKEKENNRNEQATSTAKVTRELNKLFQIN